MTEQRWWIPDKLFVGASRNLGNSAHPLMNFTAWGTDAGSKSRMQTVQNNSSQTWCMENTPQYGVRVAGTSWRDEIRLEDPRGFSVNVRSDAVLHMLQDCAVVNGVIQAACVWARTNGQNVLLVVGSENHTLAQLQTRLANSRVQLKQVRLGDWITLTNGTQGVYLGKYHRMIYESSTWTRSPSDPSKLTVDDAAKYVLWQPAIKRSWQPRHTQAVMFLSSLTVAERVDHDVVYSDAEAEHKLNQLLQDVTCAVQRTSRGYYSEQVVAASRKPMNLSNMCLTTEPITCASVDDVMDLNHKVHWSPNMSQFYLWGNVGRNNQVQLYEWDMTAFSRNELKFVGDYVRNHYHARSQVKPVSEVLQNLYAFRVTYVTPIGNQISCMI